MYEIKKIVLIILMCESFATLTIGAILLKN